MANNTITPSPFESEHPTKFHTTGIKVDYTDLSRDIRGLIYRAVHDELQKFDIKKYVDKYLKRYIEIQGRKTIETIVYKFMEESQIAVPSKYREQKITLNEYMIQVIADSVQARVHKNWRILLDKIKEVDK